jgi:hypothetical protein
MDKNITLPNGVVLNIQASDEGEVTLGFTGAQDASLVSYSSAQPAQMVLSVPAVP